MGIVSFDSMCTVWGVKRVATPGQEVNILDTSKLINLLGQNQFKVMLPSPVVAEILSPISEASDRINLYNDIKKNFIVADFDAKSALVLSEILNFHYTQQNPAYKDLGISKRCLKYDAYIISIAIAHGAECIFSEDTDFKTIAAHFISIKGLKERPDSLPAYIAPLGELGI